MQAVILAAGEGTRIRPLSEEVAKPMLPVAGEPLAARVADVAVAAGVDELVFIVGYRAEGVRAHFGDRYRGVPVHYAEQADQRGTADAVLAAREYLDGPFLVLNGDNRYDLESVADLVDRGPSVGVHQVADPTNYGVVRVDDGVVTDIVEKPDDPPTDLANTGAYHFPADAAEMLEVPESERGEHELTDVLASIAETHTVRPVRLDRWMDVGRPWELLEATERQLAEATRRVRGEVHRDADLRGTVVVEAGATIEAGVVIEGPALVQSGATVGPNAYVRGATVVGPDATVGHGCEVKNSVLLAGASVSHLSYVGDSVLGRDVNFGAGTQVANLRHDGADVRLTVKGERVSTGRRKFGVVAGHGAKTGVNTSLDPGVTLSVGATTAAGETVSRDR
ncbi:bifunctional sugar-1-phosphate nucleotidylyltransferase/acetyltransferase [Halorarius litoreus]|uniref:bifunctional sugar-1-phosphate nucleotidylyltransferase/acetyltransferase n=1 Tax=Halorarius litoreus TaxID=2962676 RepID=UPI0020CC781B|nr:bifunctional sugar-1-phosphate nucleotidylyltransferase/acetyltransferase [Halorarius litoreus]